MTVWGSSLSVSLVTSHSSLIPTFKFRGSENSAFPVSSFRAKSRNLSCTPDITTGVLGGRIDTSRFSSSNTQHFPVCKGDPSAALGMTVRGSSLSVFLGTFDPSASRILIKEVRVCAHHLIEECQYPWSLIPNPCFQILGGSEDSAFPVSSFRAKPRNLSCTPDITTGVLGGRRNTSRFSSSNT